MYQNFIYEKYHEKLMGYLWEAEAPKKILCIIHGIGEYAGRYDRVATYLKEAGIGVVSMDLPGHGLSYGKRGHAAPRQDVLDGITIMLDYAREKYPDLPIILYGHSMGGNLCLDYKARGAKNDLPEKYIVSAPWIRLTRKVPNQLYVTLKAASKVMPKATMSSGCKEEDLGNINYTGGYRKDALVHPNITLQTAVECFDIGEAIAMGKHENNGRAVGKPLLLMHGSEDKICDVKGSRMVAARMEDDPNFKYIEWPGYYHEIHNGGPNATGEDVIMTMRDYILE